MLANLLTEPLASHGGESLATLYDRLTNDVAQGAPDRSRRTDGFRVFQQTLEGQHLAISGVNLDEEAVRMITLPAGLSGLRPRDLTIDEMLEILVNL